PPAVSAQPRSRVARRVAAGAVIGVLVVAGVAVAVASRPGHQAPSPVIVDDRFARPSGWPEEDDTGGSAVFAPGRYSVTARQANAFYDVGAPVDPARLAAGVGISAETVVGPHDRALFGVFCKPSEQAFPRYVAYVQASGYWSVRRYAADGSLRVLAEAGSPEQYSRAIAPSGTNHVRLDCIGQAGSQTLALSVNGRPVAVAQDRDPLGPTQVVGLSVSSELGDPPVTVAFTGFGVRQV
ncbi:MAG: hypothetical protein ABR511_05145, partial [Acidimicrobiales bacterium]